MAKIQVELTPTNKLRVTFFSGRQGKHLRLTGHWTDWMLEMNDFRDLIIPLRNQDVDFIITKLLNNPNRINFSRTTLGQELDLGAPKKIVRRVGQGNVRKEYQSVALFIENGERQFPPPPLEIEVRDLLKLIRAMVTLDCPQNYCVRDSLRNLQYLVAILWVRKDNPGLLQGKSKPKANEIFRISLVK
mgnify:CR=1 FL=1